MENRTEGNKRNKKSREIQGQERKARVKIKIIALLLVFLFFFTISFSLGRFHVPPVEVVRILVDKLFSLFSNVGLEQTWTMQMEIIVIQVRLPRIIAAAVVGGALAVAGAVYQGMFKNPMVSPGVLGSSSGASFGAALAIFLGLNFAGVSISAFAFGLVAVFVAVFSASKYKKDPQLGLVLAGIMIGSLFSAATSFIKLVADPTDQLPAITYWLMGSLSSIKIEELAFLIPLVILGMIPLVLMRWRLNVITLGEEEARSLGINTKRLRLLVIFCATLMTATCVAVSGMIGWVGLVIPHFTRKLVGCDFKVLLPSAAIYGAAFLILVDDLARCVTVTEIPIGILTAFVGAPFFLYMIVSEGKNGN